MPWRVPHLDLLDQPELPFEPYAYATANRSAGDVNGDGRADLLLSSSTYALGEWRAGARFVVAGPVSGTLVLDGGGDPPG